MRFAPILFVLYVCAAQPVAPLPAPQIRKLAVDSAGSIYVAQRSTISKVNQWTVTVPFMVFALNMTGSGALVAAGPLPIVGNLDPRTGSIAAVDSATGKIVSTSSFAIPPGVTPQSFAITAAGNILLSGDQTLAAASPGALDLPGEVAFLAKLDPSGKMLWLANGIGGMVAADGAENIFVAGNGKVGRFPTTTNAFQTTASFNICVSTGGLIPFGFPCPQQYIAKVSPDGGSLLWSTYLTGKLGALAYDIALGPDGGIYTTGSVQATDYPTTSGAPIPGNPAKFVNTLCSCVVPAFSYPSSGFVSRLSPDGTALTYSTYLGGSQMDSASAIAVAKDGTLTVAGVAASPDFPGLPQQLDLCRPGNSLLNLKQRNFLMQISADGSKITSAQLIGGTNTGPGIACVTDAADVSFADTVSPGELITINGFGIGPSTSVVTDLQNPQTPLGGVSVTFDGIPAGLTAAGGTIVTTAVPFAIAGQTQTTMTVLHNGQVFDSRLLNVTAATQSLFVFPPDGKACDGGAKVNFGAFAGGSPAPVPFILNADGTINACDNPAASASAVTVFLNGLGVGTPQITSDSGTLVGSVSPIGNQLAVSAVSVRLPAIDPSGLVPATQTIYLHFTAGGKIVADYLVNRGVPLYVK